MKLLLAEDEIELSNALTTILQHNDYTIDSVDNGEDALLNLESNDYDGAILDIMMPKMDGLTVLKTIRSEGIKVPVIMLTAKAEIDDRVLGLDLGANDYLPKPFSTKELIARIKAMTRTKDEQVDSTLKLGNITLNRTTFELSSPTSSLRLANKEFQMMEMLMSHNQRIIHAQRFMERIWKNDNDISIVWVYISYLQKKLKSLQANIRINIINNNEYHLEVIEDD